MKGKLLTLIVLGTSLLVSGQVEIQEIFYGRPTFLRPEFKDSSLLFFRDSTVWYCNYKYQPQYFSIEIASFDKVDTCKCFVEKYIGIKSYIFRKSTPRLISKVQYGELAQFKDSIFVYLEFDKNGIVARNDTMIFNYSNIIRTSTISTFDPCTMEEDKRIYKYFEVKK